MLPELDDAGAEERPFVASDEARGRRLDVFMATLPGLELSRSQCRRLIDEGLVTVGGAPAKASQKLSPGDAVMVLIPPPVPAEARPEDLPLEILHEDPHLIVLVKAAGMVVHPAAGVRTGTLVNALLFHCHDLQGIGGTLRPGIVHRLDKGTTGVMVVAKSDAAYAGLAPQFKSHTITRRYLALAHGRLEPAQDTIDTFYDRDPHNRIKFTARVKQGRRAVTRYEVEERLLGMTLVRLRLETGRTHQIRVHLCERGHPIVGDPTYGSYTMKRDVPEALRRAALSQTRQMLHATELGFVHPATGATMAFMAPPPADFMSLLDLARLETRDR